jgi:hypothetical protein
MPGDLRSKEARCERCPGRNSSFPVTVIVPYDLVKASKHDLSRLHILYYDSVSNSWKPLNTANIVNNTAQTVSNTTSIVTYFAVAVY